MNEIVFLLDQPPKVGKGCFNELTKLWPEKVIYAYLHGFNETRKAVNWDDGEYGKASIVELGQDSDTQMKTDKLFHDYKDGIFVLCGFKSRIMHYCESYVLSDKYRIICFAERPGIYGKWWKRIIKRIYVPVSEFFISRKYKNHIKAFLPLGITGVRVYNHYGWPNDLLYPFMYDPVEYKINNTKSTANQPIRLLYVGRFSRYTKGTDTLKNAIDLIQEKNLFSLDMVGGYGDMKEEMMKWIDNKNNVNFLGRWDSTEVCARMTDYDICIVPSKFDGWNLLVNEAIRAGIGIITTNEAVSDELVKASSAGIVVKANKPEQLAQAIRFAIARPELIAVWKKNAYKYHQRISNHTTANYLADIIRYTCMDEPQSKKPSCPWILDE